MGEYTDKVSGRVKKAAGELTDDEKLKREGDKDKAKGKVKEVANDVKDQVNRTFDR
jgi:uncharacterized protein YjbJ (UPF0337 family)